ncbi:MAG: DUF2332 family protein [Rhodobacter sp.]|uniref:DUF2332 domain-containing protein n=1 Tax=Pararhodobacter sp. TaxID=2127056 RepID=UPI001DD2698D|nr:DUF2332 family protein [Pararhodobacter sp.]MCB1345790.1 DUF2332 family protein [Paracoccaceae bacterium]MCC0073961.1 DUF2332 family protein [Rhodobacter sp.]HPD91329.1 DUF2332 family protein [Pararhodobacter sp.]
MTARLRAALRQQADACAALGSPFMARLCTLLGERLTDDTPLTRRLFDWPGELGPAGASVPLRLAGALHALVLQGHADLAAVYPPHPSSDAALWQAVRAALAREAAFIEGFVQNAPQTNEVRRAAVLIAAGHWLAARHPLPMVFTELGASAGLNLMWDRFALGPLGPADAVLRLTPDWQGALPAPAPLRVRARAGVDLNPIDVTDPAQRLRLLAYLWPDQPHRRTLTEAAIAAGPPQPERADAVDWLASRLAPRPGTLHLIWSTVAWQYLPAARQREGAARIEAAGARAYADTPLAWLRYEADGDGPGAGLLLRLWPGDRTIALGRADFHGRWVRWTA